jgi:hypothetical protein
MERIVKFHLYGDYIFDGKMSEAIEFADKLISVKSQGWGKEATFVANEDDKVDFELINKSQFATAEDDIVRFNKKAVEEAEKAASEERSKRWEQDKKVKELEKELETLRSVCPHPTTSKDDDEITI